VVVTVAEEPPAEQYQVGGDAVLPIDSLHGPARDYTPIDQVGVDTVLPLVIYSFQPGTTHL
jgi:hypothetical protein